MVIGVVSVVGVGIVAAGYLYRKRLERTFGRHDEKNEENVEGKVVVVTGANTGLGKEAALEMARRGAVVVLACRDQGRTEAAMKDIRKRTSKGELIFMELDLASLESVRKFCTNFNEKFEKVDILINNAGVFIPLKKRGKTLDGYEVNFGVNHLGHFLLTNLLLDKLRSAAPSRVVVVASTLSERGKLNFDDLNLETASEDDMMFAYGTSKLANILFARELARRLSGTGVHTYALCPGWVKTELGRNVEMSWTKYAGLIVAAFLFMRTPRQGVQTILHCAVSKKVADETGKIYRNCDHWVTKSNLAEDLGKKLWEVSETLVVQKAK